MQSRYTRVPDDTTTIFRINPDAHFSDGKPVTAADVVFDLKRAQDPKAGGFYPAVFTRVKSITATDDHTVTIKLKRRRKARPALDKTVQLR